MSKLFWLGVLVAAVVIGYMVYQNNSEPQTEFIAAIKKKAFPQPEKSAKPTQVKVFKNTSSDKMNPRQQEIFAVIIRKKEVHMQDLLSAIKGVTERTLRRDLLKLSQLKLVKKSGSTKQAKYILV